MRNKKNNEEKIYMNQCRGLVNLVIGITGSLVSRDKILIEKNRATYNRGATLSLTDSFDAPDELMISELRHSIIASLSLRGFSNDSVGEEELVFQKSKHFMRKIYLSKVKYNRYKQRIVEIRFKVNKIDN